MWDVITRKAKSTRCIWEFYPDRLQKLK